MKKKTLKKLFFGILIAEAVIFAFACIDYSDFLMEILSDLFTAGFVIFIWWVLKKDDAPKPAGDTAKKPPVPIYGKADARERHEKTLAPGSADLGRSPSCVLQRIDLVSIAGEYEAGILVDEARGVCRFESFSTQRKTDRAETKEETDDYKSLADMALHLSLIAAGDPLPDKTGVSGADERAERYFAERYSQNCRRQVQDASVRLAGTARIRDGIVEAARYRLQSAFGSTEGEAIYVTKRSAVFKIKKDRKEFAAKVTDVDAREVEGRKKAYSFLCRKSSCGALLPVTDYIVGGRESLKSNKYCWSVTVMDMSKPLPLSDLMPACGSRRIPEYYDEEKYFAIGSRIAQALGEIHAGGYIHHDVKPDNLFCKDDYPWHNCLLGDFDSMRPSDAGYDGKITGSAGYMAPELRAHKPYGPSSDVYSWGRTMYALLTSEDLRDEKPVKIESGAAWTESDCGFERIFTDKYSQGQEAAPFTISKGFAEIVNKAMSPDPQERYQDGNELCRALESLEADAKRKGQEQMGTKDGKGQDQSELEHEIFTEFPSQQPYRIDLMPDGCEDIWNEYDAFLLVDEARGISRFESEASYFDREGTGIEEDHDRDNYKSIRQMALTLLVHVKGRSWVKENCKSEQAGDQTADRNFARSYAAKCYDSWNEHDVESEFFKDHIHAGSIKLIYSTYMRLKDIADARDNIINEAADELLNKRACVIEETLWITKHEVTFAVTQEDKRLEITVRKLDGENRADREKVYSFLSGRGAPDNLLSYDEYEVSDCLSEPGKSVLFAINKMQTEYETPRLNSMVGSQYEWNPEHLTSEEYIAIGCQTANALRVIHENGFVHDGVRPENVFSEKAGKEKVWLLGGFDRMRPLDVKSVGAADGGYAAPELLDGRPCGPSGDVYSWGRTMYALLTSESLTDDSPVRIKADPKCYRAWWVENDSGLARVYENDRSTGGKITLFTISKAFAEIVNRAMSPEPADRFRDGAELYAALKDMTSAQPQK